jgi:hypothetical protein
VLIFLASHKAAKDRKLSNLAQSSLKVSKYCAIAILYDLAQIRGNSAISSRIPNNISGVYPWYRRFRLEPAAKDDPELFANFILDELYKEHSTFRETVFLR